MKYKSIIILLSAALMACKESNNPTTVPTSPDEQFRPACHFSPQKNWCNDPNGMVYYAGEYHLFYQYNPQGTKWGNMSWGHAVSTDLTTWKHLPVALYPDNLGDIFSGSAVVDENNTAGLQTGNEKTLLAFYTCNKDGQGQTQALAYSTDKGRNWTKYAQNPVLRPEGNKPDFRDPKVFWYAPQSKWIMILAVNDKVEIYSSQNAKKWTYESEFGQGYGNHDGVWECPDLFELNGKWILLVNNSRNGENNGNSGSATQYFTGNFDGKNFTSEYPAQSQPANWLDWGKEHYALVTWSNAPNNRKIGIAWMNNWEYANETPTTNFRGLMSVPRELTLVQENGKQILKNYPVKEIESLRKEEEQFPNIEITNSPTVKSPPTTGVYELLLDIEKQSSKKLFLKLKNNKNEETTIILNFENSTFSIDRTKSGIVNFSEKFPTTTIAPIAEKTTYQLRILIDRCSIEAFIDAGEVSMTNLIFPNEPYSTIEFFSEGGTSEIKNFRAIKLQ